MYSTSSHVKIADTIAIIWSNVGLLLIKTLRTNSSQILIEIQQFSFNKIYFKMSVK